MFIENKYKVWYDDIINNARIVLRPRTDIIEKHHIVPKSMGGSDHTSNIVKLTTREHFVCHMLLVKFVKFEKDRRRMLHALGKFVQNGQGQSRILTSRHYEVARNAIISAKVGVPRSEETKRKISESLKGNVPWIKGKSGDPRLRCSTEKKKRISKALIGRKRSAETCEKISKSKKGHTAGMTGKAHSEETRQLMSKNMKGKRGPQKRLTQCPGCNKLNVTNRHIKFCEA